MTGTQQPLPQQQLAQNTINLKKEFVSKYQGSNSQGMIQEAIPTSESAEFPIKQKYLTKLHLFASNNPMYHNTYTQKIGKINCTIYQGDINQYWLGSITNSSSHAPFSPTWIISAFIITQQCKKLGYTQLVDVGSGDGRIAYCAKILDMIPHSIEIDSDLINLQKQICNKTQLDINPRCIDITELDVYPIIMATAAATTPTTTPQKLPPPQKTMFVIGGLAQMGGDIIASNIIKKIKTHTTPKTNCTGLLLVGTHSKKYPQTKHEKYDHILNKTTTAGWGKIIEENNLKIINTLTLPTAWTQNESEDSPYIFTVFR